MIHPAQALSERIWQAKQSNDMSDVEALISPNARFTHMGITFDKAGEVRAFNDKAFIYRP